MEAHYAALADYAYALRYWSIMMTSQAGSGHTTSALSAADIVASLFFHTMRFDPHHPERLNNDRFILSKGHAIPVVYAAWKELGILTGDDLLTYRQFHSGLEGHPTPRFKYNEAATGSLGMGLSIGLGQALASRIHNIPYHVYVLLGDSEMSEGSVWEAAEIGAFYKLENITAVIDLNRLGQSTQTMVGTDAEKMARQIESFGWHVFVVDGHDIRALCTVFDEAKKIKDKPQCVIAHTFKGYGVPRVANKEGYHGKPFSLKERDAVLQEMADFFKREVVPHTQVFAPQLPPAMNQQKQVKKIVNDYEIPYRPEEIIATRYAYGQALTAIGEDERIISLDAEVKNSTYAELFEKKYPKRFIQCFIAEQNMVSMAVGLAARGFIPFVSTFGVFFSRAFDQLRMAAIGRSPLRVVGSHAGVSIGQDGPSQMALEDIALMRTLPDSVILYPSDAVSTWKLVQLMHQHDASISYLRTTRGATPIFYPHNEHFAIGGSKLIHGSHGDVCLIIAAGITVYESLKAAEILKQDSILVAVLDTYSIKPLDIETILVQADRVQGRIVVIEDHYKEGGLGDAVLAAFAEKQYYPAVFKHLAVHELPRSGTPEELLAWAGIDAQSIASTVKSLIHKRQ